MVNALDRPINFFLQFILCLPSTIRSFVFWVLAVYAVCFVYNIIHMWVT